jgi:hypothetical protein
VTFPGNADVAGKVVKIYEAELQKLANQTDAHVVAHQAIAGAPGDGFELAYEAVPWEGGGRSHGKVRCVVSPDADLGPGNYYVKVTVSEVARTALGLPFNVPDFLIVALFLLLLLLWLLGFGYLVASFLYHPASKLADQASAVTEKQTDKRDVDESGTGSKAERGQESI